MGKKRQTVAYDREALSNMSLNMKKIRQPIKNGSIPKININLDSLEEIIREQPKKERELLERFYGLIPGTTNHSLRFRNSNDVAFINMRNSATLLAWRLLKFEYMYRYDKEVEEVVDGIVSKINKKGAEQVSDIDAVKYLLILIIFFAGGPRLAFEEEGYQINQEQEKKDSFDEYALLCNIWNNVGQEIPEGAISLKFLMETIDMFDLKDVISMKRFVRLPIEKEFEDIEGESIECFYEIRMLKERMFSEGEWNVTEALIYWNPEGKPDLTNFAKHIPKIRADWKKLQEFKTREVSIMTTKGEKKLDCYEIGGLEFTDTYEIMHLLVSTSIPEV